MKDIPMFTTQYGVASLVLREVAYQKTAYVHIRTANHLQQLVDECVGFCRAVGAQRVYATGHEALDCYPFHTAIIVMRCSAQALEDTDASLFPVQEHTLHTWLEIYRQKISHVPNGAWMTDGDGAQMLSDGSGYFIHRDGELLGIGKAREGTIEFLASVCSGAGEQVVKALSHALFSEDISLEVADTNQKAVCLYERLGFIPVSERSRWYKIF